MSRGSYAPRAPRRSNSAARTFSRATSMSLAFFKASSIASRSASGCCSFIRTPTRPNSDPPYFDNVQYAELIDFCYVWLRIALVGEIPQFAPRSTRNADEPVAEPQP